MSDAAMSVNWVVTKDPQLLTITLQQPIKAQPAKEVHLHDPDVRQYPLHSPRA